MQSYLIVGGSQITVYYELLILCNHHKYMLHNSICYITHYVTQLILFCLKSFKRIGIIQGNVCVNQDHFVMLGAKHWTNQKIQNPHCNLMLCSSEFVVLGLLIHKVIDKQYLYKTRALSSLPAQFSLVPKTLTCHTQIASHLIQRLCPGFTLLKQIFSFIFTYN